MALVSCPECGKQVSSTALACPECGFSVKNYFDQKEEEAAKLAEFERTHKNLILNDEDWFSLFNAYDYIVKRVSETSKNLLKFEKIYFNQGIPSYPLDFANAWWTCVESGYIDVIKNITKELANFSNLEIKNNLKQLSNYDFRTTMRTILLRWNQLIMAPFDNNSPAILRRAEHNYSVEVAKESQMNFGIITNSITSMALYAVQSSIKESSAIKKAEANKQSYINAAMNSIQQNVSRVWSEHFEEFLKDVELLHQIVIFELGNIVFNGYLFAWTLVDNEFVKPEKKQMYLSKKKARDSKNEEEYNKKATFLHNQRMQYIESKKKILSIVKNELSKYYEELNTIGLALWGEKAERKKILKSKISLDERSIALLEALIKTTQEAQKVYQYPYVHTSFSGFSGWSNAYSKVKTTDNLDIVYNAVKEQYEVKNESGELVELLPKEFTSSYGAYRQFSAKLESNDILFQNNMPYRADILLRISSCYDMK